VILYAKVAYLPILCMTHASRLQGLLGVIISEILTRTHNGMEMIGTDSFLLLGQELQKRLLVQIIVGHM